MNKLVACCMEGHVEVWDLRTQHPTQGFASATYTVQPSATLFAAAHMPQNRCVDAHPYQVDAEVVVLLTCLVCACVSILVCNRLSGMCGW